MLAIVVPYYKLTFFEETLQSLDNQTNKLFKVYIGDDASSENPATLLEKYQNKFDVIYHRFEENLGGISLTKQWDRCIALSNNEEWIMILGDDDVLGNNVIEVFYENLEEIESVGANVIRYATQVIDDNGTAISGVFKNPKLEKSSNFYFRRHSGLVRSSMSEHIFKRISYFKHKFKDYPIAWHSDDYAWIDFSENKPVFALNESLVKIRISVESLSGRTDNNNLKAKARSFFLKDIIFHKLMEFDKKQSLKLLMLLESDFKKNQRLSFNEWFLLFKLYLNNFETLSFIKLCRRFLISITTFN